jgi:hypothetical protein
MTQEECEHEFSYMNNPTELPPEQKCFEERAVEILHKLLDRIEDSLSSCRVDNEIKYCEIAISLIEAIKKYREII